MDEYMDEWKAHVLHEVAVHLLLGRYREDSIRKLFLNDTNENAVLQRQAAPTTSSPSRCSTSGGKSARFNGMGIRIITGNRSKLRKTILLYNCLWTNLESPFKRKYIEALPFRLNFKAALATLLYHAPEAAPQLVP
ncbi:hypothetical protein MMYC01_208635 [Madurella mycetomatis]|uniref:Uncharacterized protein n=1 Tax=Madurella mycetomatis TaxID=100816 RepID=A0A175VUS0_9PEZI|nr:hypothetical protein MMYC01_208952 [Madurella mycetomatis]KXX75268.1 hypothetical protein MMYC01_208635 [Madurella mycetomatis]